MGITLVIFSILILISVIILLIEIKDIFKKKRDKEIFYRKDDGRLNWTLIFVYISTLVGIGVLVWFTFKVGTQKLLQTTTNDELSKWGQFGDFIGGFVGIFFTITGVFLLYETLTLQRRESKASRKFFERQRFEDTLFRLVGNYKDILKEMTLTKAGDLRFSGTDYFKEQKKDMIAAFSPIYNTYQANKKAVQSYELFYTLNKENVAHYFRTLYRIFKYIDDSKYEPNEKMQYAKTVRATISEGELFFLYYNAHTEFGRNFIPLINSYNLLKHLPIQEKLEFKWLSSKLDMQMQMAVGQVLFELKQSCINVLRTKQKYTKTYFSGFMQTSIKLKMNELRIQIYKRNTMTPSIEFQKGYGLQTLSDTDLREMLVCFLLEIVEFQNFGRLNTSRQVYNKYEFAQPGRTIIWANVKSDTGYPLIMDDTI